MPENETFAFLDEVSVLRKRIAWHLLSSKLKRVLFNLNFLYNILISIICLMYEYVVRVMKVISIKIHNETRANLVTL